MSQYIGNSKFRLNILILYFHNMQTKDFYNLFKDSWVQTFDDAKMWRWELISLCPLKDTSYKNLLELNKKGAGIYIQPNPSKWRKWEDLLSIEWVYVDMDEWTKAEMMEIISKSPIAPDIIIESKRSYHLYWKVRCTKEQFWVIINWLITFYNWDPAIGSPNEVLRAPAFYHCKDPNNKFLITVKKLEIQKHEPQDFIKLYPTVSQTFIKKFNNENSDDVLRVIKNIDITEILKHCWVDVRRWVVFENGKATSATVWKEWNIVKRFSGKEWGWSTIDIVMHHLWKNVAEAIAYLKNYAGIIDETLLEKMTKMEKKGDDIFERRIPYTFGTKKLDTEMTPIEKWHCNIFAWESWSWKTAFCYYMAKNNADMWHKVLFLSLEMSTDEMQERHAREKYWITKEQWRERWDLPKDIQQWILKEKENLQKYQNLTLAWFPDWVLPNCENISNVILDGKFDLVFIDNFDLIYSDIKEPLWKSEDISKFFMDFTKNKKIPIMILHHFNKWSDKKMNRWNDSFRWSAKVVHNASNTFVWSRNPDLWIETPNTKAEFIVTQKKDRWFGIWWLCTIYYHRWNFQDEIPHKWF